MNQETFPRQSIHTEISPLRCAPVEMTKGRGAFPGRVFAEQKLLFITLGKPQPMISPVSILQLLSLEAPLSLLSSRPQRSAV
jgi:hypothetical protein